MIYTNMILQPSYLKPSHGIIMYIHIYVYSKHHDIYVYNIYIYRYIYLYIYISSKRDNPLSGIKLFGKLTWV